MNTNTITPTWKKTATIAYLVISFALQGHAAPAAGQEGTASFGFLKVFSSTQESQWGEGSYYYLHTGYRIYDSNGKLVKWIDNHDSSIDEAPQKVELVPGLYTIWAQSDKAGYVKVPVSIGFDRTTVVHLEGEGDSGKQAVCFAKTAKSLTGPVVVMSK
jgi:hypothetical protein